MKKRTNLLALIVGGVLVAAGLALALLPAIYPGRAAADVWLVRGIIAVGLVLMFPWLGGRIVRWARQFRRGGRAGR